jgi:hypothetical protein
MADRCKPYANNQEKIVLPILASRCRRRRKESTEPFRGVSVRPLSRVGVSEQSHKVYLPHQLWQRRQNKTTGMAATTTKTGNYSSNSRIEAVLVIPSLGVPLPADTPFRWDGRLTSTPTAVQRRDWHCNRHCRRHEQGPRRPSSWTPSPTIPQKGSSFHQNQSRPIPHQRSLWVSTPQPVQRLHWLELLRMRSESLNCWETIRIREHANLQRNGYEIQFEGFGFADLVSWERFWERRRRLRSYRL